MDRDEILYKLDGRVIGGQPYDQGEAIDWIATFLVSVEDNEKLVDIDWLVTIPSVNSSAEQLHFFGERKPWFIFINGEKKDKVEFIQTFAHELAHVYYEDREIPPEIKEPEHWQPIVELRADLKMEEWGALGSEFKADTYLHCDKKQWERYFPNSLSKEEALEFAKIRNTEEIINQYKNKYSQIK
jgi:hypothetical protein